MNQKITIGAKLLDQAGSLISHDGVATNIMWIKIGEQMIDLDDFFITRVDHQLSSGTHTMTIEAIVGEFEVVDYRRQSEFTIYPTVTP